MGPGSKTVLRGGFGVFVDTFPATVADNLAEQRSYHDSPSVSDGFFGGPYAPLRISRSLLLRQRDRNAPRQDITAGFNIRRELCKLGFAPA